MMSLTRSPYSEPALTPSGLPLSEAKKILIEALKRRYQLQYDAIQPVPYIRDRLFCVDKVFVEGGTVAESGIRLESYKYIFTDSRVKAKRRIIEAEAGYGKSTVTLQLAYDWCNGVKDSPLRNIEILILLRLRQLNKDVSIYQAIKTFLVQTDTRIKSTDIKYIIENCSSVEVLLDGYDEYPDRDRDTGSDVGRIITMDMFQMFDVALTTRYLPKDYDRSNTKRVRLVGFDDKARDQYIRKAVTGEDEESVAKIKRALKDNPVLEDLCDVPLFFVMFAHMTHEKEEFQKFKSVTEFFRFMIKCLHTHLQNKTRDRNTKTYNVEYELNFAELSNVAFEGLSRKNQQLTWNKTDMIKRLGQGFYNHYIAVGILVEEEVFDERTEQTKTEVRFYHKLFCEWYACFTLVDIVAGRSEWQTKSNVRNLEPFDNVARASETERSEWQTKSNVRNLEPFDIVARASETDLSIYLQNMDPFDLQYFYRFSCGINPRAGSKIIEYLKRRKDGDKIAILCILEQTGKVDDIKETITDLCSRNVEIHGEGSPNPQSKLLQRSIIQLLEIAAMYDIPISSVYLGGCSPKVSEFGLTLQSGLSLSILSSLQQLVIHDPVRSLTNEEFVAILGYFSQCTSLKQLKFLGYCLPDTVPVRSIPSSLKSRNVTVRRDNDGYLNLSTGLWEISR